MGCVIQPEVPLCPALSKPEQSDRSLLIRKTNNGLRSTRRTFFWCARRFLGDNYKDNAETTLWLGAFQSSTGRYVSRRQRYGSSTTNPGRGALIAIDSMSWSTVLCWVTLPGAPRAWPNGQCRYKKRGA